MDFQHGAIYQADGQLYRIDADRRPIMLWRVREDDPATLPVASVGDLIAFAVMPDGNLARVQMATPESPPITFDLPGGQLDLDHLADSNEEYLFKRSMGYYRLQEGHVYRLRDQLLYAWRPPKQPEWDWTVGLYLLNPATYELIDRAPGTHFAYGKIGKDVWREWYWPTLASANPADLDFEDLEHIGPCEPLYDDALDARFREMMKGL